MFNPRLLFAFVLFSLLITLVCGSMGQGQRPLDRYRNPTVTTTEDLLSLTPRLRKVKSKAWSIARCYTIHPRLHQVQRNLPTEYHQPSLHALSSHANLRGYASSIQSPNPPPLASTSGNQPDITGMYIPDSSNAVRVEVKQVGARAWLVYRTINFPSFTTMNEFSQTVEGMDLPGEPLTPDMLLMQPKIYMRLLEDIHYNYIGKVDKARPGSTTLLSTVREQFYRAKSAKTLCDRFTLFEKYDGERFKASAAISRALGYSDAILIMYCKKSDENTYLEVIWYPKHPEFSAERILAYTMRRYERVKPFSIQTDGDYGEFLNILKRAMESSPVDICSQFVNVPLTLPALR